MLGLAVTISIGSTVVGLALAHLLRREAGPLVIVAAAGVFFVELLGRWR